jgi:hypothetical protein
MKTLTKKHLYLSIGAVALALCGCTSGGLSGAGRVAGFVANAATVYNAAYSALQPKQAANDQTAGQRTDSQPANNEPVDDTQEEDDQSNN